MIIYLLGVHGSGKTSLIENLRSELPVTKILNLDLNPKIVKSTNPSAANQQLRHSDYFDNLTPELKKHPEHIILIDRAPFSLNVYDRTFKEIKTITNKEYEYLKKDYDDRLKRFKQQLSVSGHSEYYVYLNTPIDQVKLNIIKRGRNRNLNEEDWRYLETVYKEYGKEIIKLKPDQTLTLEWDSNKSVIDNYDWWGRVLSVMIKKLNRGFFSATVRA